MLLPTHSHIPSLKNNVKKIAQNVGGGTRRTFTKKFMEGGSFIREGLFENDMWSGVAVLRCTT